MVMNVAGALNAYRQTAGTSASIMAPAAAPEGGVSFSDTLSGFMTDSLNAVREGEKAAAAGTAGKADMQSVIMAVDKASTMLETVVAIRDRVVTAFQEIMRMQI